MKIICEMAISDLFRLSSGHVAIVGKIEPNIEHFIPNNSKADLYMSGKKIMTINIIGEDRFSGVDEVMRQSRRSVRTDSKIPSNFHISHDAKLVIFE